MFARRVPRDGIQIEIGFGAALWESLRVELYLPRRCGIFRIRSPDLGNHYEVAY